MKPKKQDKAKGTESAKLTDDAGKPVGRASTERDIIARKWEEEALWEANQYLENLINYANAPIIVWDPVFRITRFNHAFEKLTGRTAEEVVGRSIELLFPLDRVESSMDLIRKTSGGERWETVEIDILHCEGSVRTVLWNSATLLSGDGKTPISTIAQGHDITDRKRVEAELHESERRNRALAESLPHLVWTCRADGPCDYLSPRWVDYTGIPEADQLGYGWLDQVHPDDRERVIAEWSEVAPRGSVFDIEFRIRRADGVHRWFKTRAIPFRDNGGRVVKWFGSNTDIDDQKRAHETLRESEAKYRTLIENIPQKILMKDRKFRWVSINENLARDFGIRPEEVVGKTDADLFPPELATKYHADDVWIMETGQTKEFEERYIQEGRETWVNTIKTPVKDANGKIVGMLGVFWDITERKRTEESLLQSEKRFRSLAVSTSQIIWSTDAQGMVYGPMPSFQAYTGQSDGEIRGSGWGSALHPDDVERTIKVWKEAVEAKAGYLTEYRLRRHDGVYRYFTARGAPVVADDGHILEWIGTCDDITERKDAEEALRETNQYLENLFNYANAPIIVWDPQFRITRFNHAFEKMTGRTASEVVGRSIEILFPTDRVASSMDLIRETSGGERWETVEIDIFHRDGQVRTVLWNSATLFSKDGKIPVATIAQGQDITERKRLEAELTQTNEANFRNIFDNASDGIILAKMGSRNFYLGNPAICRMLGYSPDEIKNLGVMDIHPEKDLPYVIDQFEKQARGEITLSRDLPVKSKDSNILYVDVNASTVTLAGTKYLMGFFHDNTERKKIEDALRASEARYTLYLEVTGQIGWTTPADGIVDDMPEWRKYTGQSIEEVKGWGWLNAMHPDDRERTTEVWNKAVATKSIYETEYRIRRHDGVYRYFLARGIPSLREDGTIHEWVGTCIDITERKKTETELLQSKHLLDETGRLARVGGWEIDLGANTLSWTDTVYQIHEVGPEYKPTVENGINFYAPEAVPVISEAVRLAISDGLPFDLELPLITAKRNRVWVHAVGKPIRDNGKIVKIGGVFQDITERKKKDDEVSELNAELQASNKELEAFSYSVSHDLRAPLRAADGFSRILVEDYSPQLPPEAQRFIGLVRSNTLQMGRLVDDLLALSRLGRQAMNADPITPAQLVKEALDLLRGEHDGRNVKITIGDLPTCLGDRGLLKQVFVNLLSNAFKFTRKCDPAVLEVGCSRKNGESVFFVRDNGVGFDMRYVGKLFGVFQRLHRAEDFEGTGVGLAIVQRIIHRHGGRVWAEGEMDKGATFYFTLKGESK